MSHTRLIDRLDPEAAGRLLARLATTDAPPVERRIFVNRTLRMGSIRHIGFDLDWTLADYERLPLEKVTFELALDRLIEHSGYPDAARQAAFRPEFPRRGLLIDKRAGTVLGMSRHRYVNRAFHGRERLGREDLKNLYRYEPVRPTSDRFYHLDSLFELPEANLYSELIELTKKKQLAKAPREIFDDVRSAIDWVHAEGALKRRVLASPEVYLAPDEELAPALLRLSLRNRNLFVVTNSEFSYVDGVCRHLFDGALPGLESWRQLFDLVIVDSAKPRFFREQRPFVSLDPQGHPTGETETPAWGGIYSGGCLAGLMKLIGEPGESVLYVGDHIYGDIVSSKLESTWRTALVVHELEEEIHKRRECRGAIAEQAELAERLSALGGRMDHLRDVVRLLSGGENGAAGETESDELAAARAAFRQLFGEHQEVLRNAAQLADEIDAHFNPYWGAFFKQGPSKTRFARQLETYACLYTSRVANFGLYGSDHYFRVAHDPMTHELVD